MGSAGRTSPGALFFSGHNMTKSTKPTAGKKAGISRNRKEPAGAKLAMPDTADLATRIGLLLKAFEEQLTSDKIKITVADYIRLLQFQRDFEGERPKDIEVTWVDSLKEKKSSEK
jgi:hypothetical protein